jgi:hypothetical protein
MSWISELSEYTSDGVDIGRARRALSKRLLERLELLRRLPTTLGPSGVAFGHLPATGERVFGWRGRPGGGVTFGGFGELILEGDEPTSARMEPIDQRADAGGISSSGVERRHVCFELRQQSHTHDTTDGV